MMAPQKSAHIKEPAKQMTTDEIAGVSLQAVALIPGVLSEMQDVLEDINDSMNLIALYLKRKGEQEGLWQAGDFDEKPAGEVSDGTGN